MRAFVLVCCLRVSASEVARLGLRVSEPTQLQMLPFGDCPVGGWTSGRKWCAVVAALALSVAVPFALSSVVVAVICRFRASVVLTSLSLSVAICRISRRTSVLVVVLYRTFDCRFSSSLPINATSLLSSLPSSSSVALLLPALTFPSPPCPLLPEPRCLACLVFVNPSCHIRNQKAIHGTTLMSQNNPIQSSANINCDDVRCKELTKHNALKFC